MKRSNQYLKNAFGIILILAWFAVILYSSYRIELGLTEIGHGFILFLKRMLQRIGFIGTWELNWMESALHWIVHIEAFILLGVFAGVAADWWEIRGRRRVIMVILLGFFAVLADESYQYWILHGSWNNLDLIWESIGIFVGLKIEDFVAYSNR